MGIKAVTQGKRGKIGLSWLFAPLRTQKTGHTKDGAMLIGLPAILGPDLLYTLRAMGHGDEIALVDGNYPAQAEARRLVRADSHGLIAVLDAILLLLPLDRATSHAIFRASLNNDAAQRGSIHDQIDAACFARAPAYSVQPLSGADLYPRIRLAHTVVATSETALFANVILRKGVIGAGMHPL